MIEFNEALEALRIARNHFENALPEYVEAAISELIAAERKFEAMRSRA